MQTTDDHEIALGQGGIAACMETHEGCCRSPGGFGGGPGLQVFFLHPAVLGELGASTLGSLTVKGLRRRWMDPACYFREVLKGTFGSTMSDELRPPQKSSSNVLRHSL